MINRRRPRRTESGAAMVEFVMVLPFFLAVIFGLVSWAGMLSFRQTLSQAATEGARAAVISPTTFVAADRRAAAINAVNGAFQGIGGPVVACGTGGLTCTIPDPTSCGGSATCMSVTLTYAYAANPRIPVSQFFSFALPTNLGYTASARIQ